MDEPSPQYRSPDGADDATISALGRFGGALDAVESARGHLYEFHRLCGRADLTLGDAVDELSAAGRGVLADRIERELVGRNILEGRWSFQVVEEYDRDYCRPFVDLEAEARRELVGGKRHLFEAEMKERRRSRGDARHVNAGALTFPRLLSRLNGG